MEADEPIAGGDVGEEAAARARELIGHTVDGRYRIDELVAQGGIASVFRATRLADGHEMALKVLHREAEERPALMAHFEREAIAGKHIFHPNVVTVHESGRLADGSWYLVQDFVHGETLRALIDRGPVPPRFAASIARQVAAGLTAAHDMGIVHRDIKPRNLMVSRVGAGGREPKVHIVDFGLAQVPVENLALDLAHGRESLSQTDVVFGTMAYLAPEAARGMKAIDRRSDLYALGVILYEMLAGVHPFTGSGPVEVFIQQCNAIPLPIGERAPGVEVPPPLERVVRRMLEKEPAARFQHARAVVVALDNAITEMKGAQAAIAAPMFTGLTRGQIAALAAALAVFLSTVVWALVRQH